MFAKRKLALQASCIVIFASLSLFAVSLASNSMAIEDEKMWDMETTRLEDYSLMLRLNEDVVYALKRKSSKEDNLKESVGKRLTQQLQTILEEQISKMLTETSESKEAGNDKILEIVL